MLGGKGNYVIAEAPHIFSGVWWVYTFHTSSADAWGMAGVCRSHALVSDLLHGPSVPHGVPLSKDLSGSDSSTRPPPTLNFSRVGGGGSLEEGPIHLQGIIIHNSRADWTWRARSPEREDQWWRNKTLELIPSGGGYRRRLEECYRCGWGI